LVTNTEHYSAIKNQHFVEEGQMSRSWVAFMR